MEAPFAPCLCFRLLQDDKPLKKHTLPAQTVRAADKHAVYNVISGLQAENNLCNKTTLRK